jgi:serine/threonine protein kinase
MSDSSDQVGFTAPLPTDLAPLFPGYEIQGLIATGGMGAVYCAVQKSLDRTVAIKILPLELSKDAAFCAGFESEAKAMARLNHPNLIGVYDFGEVNGMLYIVMEFVPGKSIYHSAYGTALAPSEVIRLISAICDGLAHAHENGIIHRDIKPSNILLDLNAQPKIGDFGLARPVERKIEEGEEIFGTPHYTAPEVVNQPHLVDHRADIFSLGVMLHELLTGKLPANDPRPASTIVRCDPRLDAIIRRATQPLPAARYASAAEMATDLRGITATKVPGGAKTSPMRPPRPARPAPVRRTYRQASKKSSSSSAILLLLAVAAAGVGYFFLSEKPPAPVVVPANVTSQAKPPTGSPKPNLEEDETGEIEPEPALDRDMASKPTIIPPPPPPPPLPTPSQKEPDTDISAAPKFDVPGFYEKARKIMQERCKSLLSTYQAGLQQNVANFEKTSNRAFRRMDYGKARAEATLAAELKKWEFLKYHLPPELPNTLISYDDLVDAYEKCLKKQGELDKKLQSDLESHAAVYVLGLEKEIERRQADNDPASVTLIRKEIDLTKEIPTHFFKLMVGNTSSSDLLDP